MVNEIKTVFFDLGDTLGTAVLSPPPSRLVSFDVFPFVPPLLESLKGRGLRLGVISNTGEDGGTAVDSVLETIGLLPFFEPELRIYSKEVGLRKDSPEIFRLAAERTGLPDAARHCLFVGEDGRERGFAAEAGMRVSPHPLLVPEVLDGLASRFVRVTVPAGQAATAFDALRMRPFVALHVAGSAGSVVYGIASQRVATELMNMRLGVELLGEPGLPDRSDLYLLRDDAAAESGFMSPQGEAGRFFASGDDSRLL